MDANLGLREGRAFWPALVYFDVGFGFLTARWERVHIPDILVKVVIQEKQLLVLSLMRHAHFLSFSIGTLWPLPPLYVSFSNSQLWQGRSAQAVCSHLVRSITSTEKTYIVLQMQSVSIYRRFLFRSFHTLHVSSFRLKEPGCSVGIDLVYRLPQHIGSFLE